MRRIIGLLFAALAGLIAMPAGALAQEGSPVALPGSLVVCAVEPRDAAATTEFWFDPSGTPLATPQASIGTSTEAELEQGTPADEETIAAIDIVVREWVACFDQGQYLRAFALMTDELLREYGPNLANPGEDTAQEVIDLLNEQLAATPTTDAATVGQATPIEGPRDVRVLDDGRVGAIYLLGGDEGFIILEEQDGQWLIDELIGLAPAPEATPTS